MSYLLVNADARRIPLADQSVHMCVTSPPYWGLRSYLPDGHGDKAVEIGLEATPELFAAGMVAVFREVWRVLRDDGTAWINLGSSYAGSWSGHSMRPGGGDQREGGPGFQPLDDGRYPAREPTPPGFKPKDLIPIPWMVAMALQADGWYLRDAIVWAKSEVSDDDEIEGSAMPGSQRDRCTSAHEMIFMLAKRPRYYFDQEGCKTKSDAILRNVWRMNPEASSISHYATFPRELPRRAISLGTSERGVCPRCGAPWRRLVESERIEHRPDIRRRNVGGRTDGFTRIVASGGIISDVRHTTGWSPGCTCGAGEPIPATILDPFAGSGTSLVVAEALGRRGIGLDLSAEYLGMARRRIERPYAAVARPGREERHPLFEGADTSP